MPNPTIIHPNSTRTKHFLAIADFYIRIGRPSYYEVEPDFDEYRPDVYMMRDRKMISVEVQLTHISTNKMQNKVDNWANTYIKGLHQSKKLWIVTDVLYNLEVPEGFEVEFHKWTVEKKEEVAL